jgi:GNAT superfamily N-acetyltransferase
VEVVIREATVDDADRLGAVHVAAWQAAYSGLIGDDHLSTLDPAVRAAWWRRGLAARDRATVSLVAVVDGRIAGFITYGPPEDEVAEGWGQLYAINLHPDFWRQGVGTRLFAAGLQGLADLGYRHGYLWVLDGNERAIAFYHRQGWPLDGLIKTDDEFDLPLIVLRCSGVLNEKVETNRS